MFTHRDHIVEKHLEYVFSEAKELLKVGDPNVYVDEYEHVNNSIAVTVRLNMLRVEMDPGDEVTAKDQIKTYLQAQDRVKDSIYSWITRSGILPPETYLRLETYSTELDVWVANHPPVDGDLPIMAVDALFYLGLSFVR